METAFKIVFFLGVLIFCLVIIGIFLLLIRITFMFTDQVQIMGILMMPGQ